MGLENDMRSSAAAAVVGLGGSVRGRAGRRGGGGSAGGAPSCSSRGRTLTSRDASLSAVIADISNHDIYVSYNTNVV